MGIRTASVFRFACWLGLIGSSGLSPLQAWSDPVLTGQNPPGQPYHFEIRSLQGEAPLRFYPRTGRDTFKVPPEEESKYHGGLLGEVEMTFSELPPGRYHVTLGNAEYRTHSQHNRVYDIFLNGEQVYDAYCHFDLFGFRTGGTVEFEVDASDGAITLALKRDLPQSEWPRFAWVRLDHLDSDFQIEKTANDFSPDSAEIRAYTNRHPQDIVRESKPPFPGQYKIKPEETDRLTPADIIGPDGIVYPNWLEVGIDGGIPYVADTFSAADFGAKPDDPIADSAAIQAALDAAERSGGGAVKLAPGRYVLDFPLFIHGDGVVLRGSGQNRTVLSFEYFPPAGGLDLWAVREESAGIAGPDTLFMAWADFDDLETLRWSIGDVVLGERDQIRREGYHHSLSTTGRSIIDQVGPGEHTLIAEAIYRDGRTERDRLRLEFRDQAGPSSVNGLHQLAAINVLGKGLRDEPHLLIEDGLRGSAELMVDAAEADLPPGTFIDLHAPATERWNTLVRNAAPWGNYRRNIYRVGAVEENRWQINQPLRLDFPTIDGSTVQRLDLVVRSGVEDLKIVQPRKLWTSGINLFYAWECWIDGVVVEKAGRHSFYTGFAKKCEIRNSVFDDVWFKQGGGSGYIGFERAYDCLMESVVTYSMRHAPNLQWAAAGNVIRQSHFNDSDGQWHAGWTQENLFEEITISSGWDNGNYGYGLYSSSPEAGFHGPTGPRNVVYNSDISAPSNGIWMGGMNENFILAYNRFINSRGPAVYGKHASFNHIIKGNVFVSMDPYPAVFYFASEDCIGIEITDNRIIGPVSALTGGPARVEVLAGNTIEPTGDIMRPKPEHPSIFEWQQEHGRQQLESRGHDY
jgi:hypothetical protein